MTVTAGRLFIFLRRPSVTCPLCNVSWHFFIACSSVESSRLYFIRSTSFLRLRHYRETQTLLTHWRDIPVHSLLLHRHRLLPLNRPEDVWLRMSTLYLDVMSYVVGLRTSILFLDVFCYSAVFWLVSRIHFTLYYILFTIGPCFIANSLKSQ